MRIPILPRRVWFLSAGAAVAVAVIGAAFAAGPITRTLIALDGVCLFCHAPFDPDLEVGRRHPEDASKAAAKCADCHVVPGFLGAVYTYSHLASVTDLYGGLRWGYADSGEWLTPAARRTHRARDGMFETDSSSCRSCHVEAEIKPRRVRGQRSHAEAREKKITCINCHFNLVHREIEPRQGFVK